MMKNWMIELEKVAGAESTKMAANAVSVCLTVATMLVGNWHLFL